MQRRVRAAYVVQRASRKSAPHRQADRAPRAPRWAAAREAALPVPCLRCRSRPCSPNAPKGPGGNRVHRQSSPFASMSRKAISTVVRDIVLCRGHQSRCAPEATTTSAETERAREAGALRTPSGRRISAFADHLGDSRTRGSPGRCRALARHIRRPLPSGSVLGRLAQPVRCPGRGL